MDAREFLRERRFCLERLPQSVIIDSGSRESRSEIADILVMAAECSQAEKPCGVCPGCRKCAAGTHPDVYRVCVPKGKKLVSVAQIRDVRYDAYIRPHEGAARAFVFPDADLLTDEAQNALLKVMEEPPAGLLLVFCLPFAGALLSTVRSRSVCISLPFETERSDSAASLKRSERAAEIVDAAVSGSEADLIASCVPLDRDRELMKEVFALIRMIIRDALAERAGGTPVSGCPVQARALSQSLSRAKLLKTDAAFASACAALERNAKESLVSSKLCGEIKSIMSE